MEVSEGHFDRARALAERELKFDSNDALAELVLLIERVKTGDGAGAISRAEALPEDGVHRFIAPAGACLDPDVAVGDLAGGGRRAAGSSTNSTALHRSKTSSSASSMILPGDADTGRG